MNFTGGVRQILGTLLWAVLLLVTAARESDAVESDSHSMSIASVAVGVGGHYKVGHWTPVVVTLEAHKAIVSGRLVLITADDEGLSTRYVDDELITLSVGSHIVERYVRFGNRQPELRVEFIYEDDSSTQRVFTASELPAARESTSELVVVVGHDIGVTSALPTRTYRQKRETHVIQLDSVIDLPQRAIGLDAVDLITLSTSQIEKVPPSSHWSALTDWLLVGGRAVIACGRQGEVLFGDGGLLQSIAPGKFDRVGLLRRTAALEAYAGSAQRLDTTRSLDMLQFQQVRGRVEASDGNSGAGELPLVVQYPAGFGQISLITVDLDQPPLSDWPGRTKMMARILAFHQPGETGKGQGDRQNLPPAQLGYHDLTGQLRMALDQLQGVRLIAFSWVAVLIAVYILLVGPGDYFLVRFGLRRMQATWVTLGVISMGFIALAWWMDGRLKSSHVVVSQAEIIDLDAQTGIVRGSSWMHIYSPRTAAYALQPKVTPLMLQAPSTNSALQTNTTLIGWQGLPGEGLGGLDGRQAPVLFDSPYQIAVPRETDSPAQLAGAPVQTASTKGFVTRFWHHAATQPAVAFQVTSDGLLTGRFDYPLNLELEDAAIYYDRFLYRINGVVKPGRTLELTPTSNARDMRFHLTQKRVIDSKEIVTPWNPRSTDVTRILEVMMLHKAAGGDNYTGLTARYDPRIDLSDHLATGRAILIGRARSSPVSWGDEQLDSAVDQAATMVRIVIPVSPVPQR